MTVNRRVFLKTALLAPAALRVWAADAPAAVRFGLISDVRQDVMPDGVERLRAFVAAMQQAKVDFILQLGDFCQPGERNKDFLSVWNAFAGPRWHVLGNHDMDGGGKKDAATDAAREAAVDAGNLCASTGGTATRPLVS